jgi:putative flippase GtrA
MGKSLAPTDDAPAMIARLIRFVGVGGFCAGLSYLVFILGLRAGLHYLAANATGWLCAVGAGFLLNRSVTFQMNDWSRWPRQFTMFVAGSFAQLALSTAGLAVLMGGLGLGPTLAFLINTALGAALMFAYLNLVAFRR